MEECKAVTGDSPLQNRKEGSHVNKYLLTISIPFTDIEVVVLCAIVVLFLVSEMFVSWQ